MFISRHTLKWTKTCRSSGDFPHAHTAHFLLNRHSAPLAASRHRLRQAPAGARAPEGRLRGARGDRRDGAVARRKSAYTSDFERQVAWLSVHAPRSAVSALMRVDWKSVGPICRRVPLGHRGVLEARREDRPPPLRHPAHHPVRTIQRSPGGRQQQDQDHHQDGLRLQGTSATSSPWSCSNAAASTSNSPDANNP